MKVIVAIKHAVDHNLKPFVTDGQVDLSQARRAINPFDEIALEEAVRLKERGQVTEILAVTIGGQDSKDSLRHAYAMGADRALLIEAESGLQPLAVAKILKAVVEREQPGLIFLGKQAVGEDYGQTGQMLAGILRVGLGTFASAIELNDGFVNVTREIDKGTQRLRLKLPAVITADLRLNEPRFIKLPNLMMAKKKPIDSLNVTELGLDLAPRFTKLISAEPPEKPGAVIMANANELVSALRKAEVLK